VFNNNILSKTLNKVNSFITELEEGIRKNDDKCIEIDAEISRKFDERKTIQKETEAGVALLTNLKKLTKEIK